MLALDPPSSSPLPHPLVAVARATGGQLLACNGLGCSLWYTASLPYSGKWRRWGELHCLCRSVS